MRRLKFTDKIRVGVANWLFPAIADRVKGGDSLYNIEKNKYIEGKVWYEGDEDAIAEFYDNIQCGRATRKYFYKNLFGDDTITHSGLPKKVSDTMARLIFGPGLQIAAKEEDEELNEDIQKTLDTIMKENKMNSQHNEGGVVESWGSKFAYKISFDSDLSNYVIIELIEPQNYDTVKNRGRIQEFHFYEDFNEGKQNYRLVEIYGINYIDYKLFKVKDKYGPTADYKEVPLNSTAYTQDYERFEFDGDFIMAAEKTNKTICGESDYKGLYSEFDALDRAWSNFTQAIQDGQTDIYIPEEYQPMSENGAYLPLRLNKKYMAVKKVSADDIQKIQYEQPSLRTDEYTTAIDAIGTNILSSVGISPTTIDDGNIGANASGDSIREREKLSLRTRDSKIEQWEEFLEDFYNIVLKSQDVFEDNPFVEYVIDATFGAYLGETPNERADVLIKKSQAVGTLVMNGIVDTEKALEMLFDEELSEEELERILIATGEKFEDIEEEQKEVVEEVVEE